MRFSHNGGWEPMPAAGGAEFEYSLADPEFGEKAHQELSSECSFEYHLPLSQLYCRKLNFYLIFRPSDQNMPIMPLGNDTVWVLRANKHYGLDLKGRILSEDDPGPIG